MANTHIGAVTRWADRRIYRRLADFREVNPALTKAMRWLALPMAAVGAGAADLFLNFGLPKATLLGSVPAATLLAWRAGTHLGNRIELAEMRGRRAAAMNELLIQKEAAEELVKDLESKKIALEDLKQEALGRSISELTITQNNQEITQRYVLSEEIGVGGQASVRLAINLSQNNRLEVLKIAHPQFSKDAAYRDRFLGEAKLLQGLEHPKVVNVYGYGEMGEKDDKRLFYSMEFVQGTDLAVMLQRVGRMGMLEATNLIIEIAEVFADLHDNSIIHRDIKPDNILLTSTGVKIIDFGIARDTELVHRMTQTGSVFGTPAYMPQEQMMGLGKADARSDVYALAVTFYETIIGELPIPLIQGEGYGGFVKRYLEAIGEGKYPPKIGRHFQNIDTQKMRPALQKLQEIVNYGLAVEVEDRYQGMRSIDSVDEQTGEKIEYVGFIDALKEFRQILISLQGTQMKPVNLG